MNIISTNNINSPSFTANINKISQAVTNNENLQNVCNMTKNNLLRKFHELYGEPIAAEFVQHLKVENLKYLYSLASKVDLSGYLRIELRNLQQFSQMEMHKLKQIEPLLLSKNDLGLWNYPAEYVLNFRSLNKKQQATLLNLAQCNVTPFSAKSIIEYPDLNWDKTVDKARAIKNHYGDDLREIEFYSNSKGENFFLADVQLHDNKKPAWLNYKRITVKLDDDVNAFAGINKQTKIAALVDDLYAKITRQLNIYSEKNLEDDIAKISKAVPEATLSEILTTIQKITQFANFSSLSDIAEQLTHNRITAFDSVGELNKYFEYFHENKGLFKLSNSKEKLGSIVTLNDLNNKDTLQIITENVAANNLTLINLEGFSDGVNLFGDDRNLPLKAVSVLKKAKAFQTKYPDADFAECVSFVLNNPIEAKLKKLGLSAIRVSIENPATKTGILKQIQPVVPSKERIKTTIESIADRYSITKRSYNNLSKSIAEYFNSNVQVYSKQSMIQALEELNNKIVEYLQSHNIPKENLYLLQHRMRNVKSFDILMKMYKDLFNFPESRMIQADDVQDLNKYPKNSAFLILDDIIGSGDSMIGTADYCTSAKKLNKDKFIIFVPITATETGLANVNKYITKHSRSKNDTIIFLDKNVLEKADGYKIFKNWYLKMKSFFGSSNINDKGFKEQALNVSFPYMAPDNNSFISANLQDLFLINDSCIKNKPYSFEKLKKKAADYDLFGQDEKYLLQNSVNDKAPTLIDKIKFLIRTKLRKEK